VVETLYKIKWPGNSPVEGEFYELSLEAIGPGGVVGCRVTERHGWWDEQKQAPVWLGPTLLPDEGYPTLEEAQERYNQQRLRRVKDGFKHSYRLDMHGDGPIYREISAEGQDAE